MQTATVEPSPAVRAVLAGAYGAASRVGVVGTEHVLVGLTGRVGGSAARVLDEFDVTLVTAMDAVREPAWTVDDDDPAAPAAGSLGTVEWTRAKRPSVVTYTGAARSALARAMATATAAGRTEFDLDDLLDALLATQLAGPNRAIDVLSRWGADPERVRERLAGGPPPDRPAHDDDLMPTRDAVLGRSEYRVTSIAGRMAYSVLRLVGANVARTPVPWIRMDALDQARRLGHRRARTAHVVLALLAVHEVTRDLPHLVATVSERYSGARALAEAGLTYRAARAVVAADPPGRDPRRLGAYVDRRPDTAALVRAILDGNTSAVRLLTALGVAPDQVLVR